MKGMHMLTWILVIIGGLNWLLVGLFDWNLVTALVGNWPWLEKLIYILVGLSALWELITHKKNCKMCSKSM